MGININLGSIIKGLVRIFKGDKNLKHETESMTKPSSIPDGKTEEQFVNLVRAFFGNEYQIVDNYDVKNIDPSVFEARRYTLAFFKNNQLVLTILYTKHNGDRNRFFINAKRACEERGIKCLTFYDHFPNEDGYVLSRIKENL